MQETRDEKNMQVITRSLSQKCDRVVKKSRYIPKRLVPKVERMNGEKVSVRKILEVLGVKE